MGKTEFAQTWCEHIIWDHNFEWVLIDCEGKRKVPSSPERHLVTLGGDWKLCPICGAHKPSTQPPPMVCSECKRPVDACPECQRREQSMRQERRVAGFRMTAW